MPKIGAHVSAAVSLDLSLDRAKEIGVQCTQIFVSPPQQWLQTSHNNEEIQEYLKKQTELGIGPNFIHGTYLVNLGTDKSDHLQKSIDWLKYGMAVADELQIQGVIFHPGSHKGRGFETIFDQLIKAIQTILEDTKNSQLILENCSGSGGVIGSLPELGQILNQIKDDRLKICIDTQHSFGAGYDIRDKDRVERFVKEIEDCIGWKNVAAIHCNDSKVELGSLRDRHENIGEGFIGKTGFKNLLNHPKLQDKPFILEVPGFSGNGPDKENVDTLKSLLDN